MAATLTWSQEALDDIDASADYKSHVASLAQDGDWWIGWVEEVPGVNCQEATREELLKSLRITLAQAIDMNRTDPLPCSSPTPP